METEIVIHGKDHGHELDLRDGKFKGNMSHELIIANVTVKN